MSEPVTVIHDLPPPELGGWQPIESAPKDCRILFLAYGDTVFAGEWNEFRNSFEPDYWEGPSFDAGDITHWMPLPEPPNG
jgi:hypothetical protein